MPSTTDGKTSSTHLTRITQSLHTRPRLHPPRLNLSLSLLHRIAAPPQPRQGASGIVPRANPARQTRQVPREYRPVGSLRGGDAGGREGELAEGRREERADAEREHLVGRRLVALRSRGGGRGRADRVQRARIGGSVRLAVVFR